MLPGQMTASSAIKTRGVHYTAVCWFEKPVAAATTLERYCVYQEDIPVAQLIKAMKMSGKNIQDSHWRLNLC